MTDDGTTLNIRTVLFVPGDRPERFDKALASGAHLVCIDLEDAVAPEQKDAARKAALAYLLDHASDALSVRINRVGSRSGLADLLAIADVRPRLPYILIPKVESVAKLDVVARALESLHIGLIPLIESVAGLAEVTAVSAARHCAAVMFGGHDFASELGANMEWEPLLTARSMIAYACARAGVLAIDAPFIAIKDLVGLEHEARRARALGFEAKAAIHPAQIETIHKVYRPTDAEIDEARDAISAFQKSIASAVQFRGRLLDKPMIRKYERTLACAGGIVPEGDS